MIFDGEESRDINTEPIGTPLFQITEADLCDLEHMLPLLAEITATLNNNRFKLYVRKLKQIVSDVRRRYQPWSDVEVLPVEE